MCYTKMNYEEFLVKLKEKGAEFALHLTEMNNLNNDAMEKVEILQKK